MNSILVRAKKVFRINCTLLDTYPLVLPELNILLIFTLSFAYSMAMTTSHLKKKCELNTREIGGFTNI